MLLSLLPPFRLLRLRCGGDSSSSSLEGFTKSLSSS